MGEKKEFNVYGYVKEKYPDFVGLLERQYLGDSEHDLPDLDSLSFSFAAASDDVQEGEPPVFNGALLVKLKTVKKLLEEASTKVDHVMGRTQERLNSHKWFSNLLEIINVLGSSLLLFLILSTVESFVGSIIAASITLGSSLLGLVINNRKKVPAGPWGNLEDFYKDIVEYRLKTSNLINKSEYVEARIEMDFDPDELVEFEEEVGGLFEKIDYAYQQFLVL